MIRTTPPFNVTIFIIPIIVMTLSFLLKSATGPLWQYCDPCYGYLFFALNMIKGLAPNYIDHPGTPLEGLILIVMWITNLGQSASTIIYNVLKNPESYLSITNSLLILLSFLTSVLLGHYIYQKTQNWVAALLTQLPSLSFLTLKSFTSPYPILPVVTNATPEPLLISVVNLFNLSFLMLFFTKNYREEFKATLLLGFICGLGGATKINFLPLLLPCLIIISWRLKLTFILTFFLSFILWTIPIIHKYPLLLKWMIGILTHTGAYGMGSQGIADWHHLLFTSLKDIFHDYWHYMILISGIFAYSSIKIIKTPSDRNIRFLWAATIGVLFQVFIVAKHFSMHYMVPALGFCGSVFFLFYVNKLAQNKILRGITIVFILLFAIQNIAQAIIYCSKLSDVTRHVVGLHERIYSKYPNCTIIASNSNTPSLYLNQEFALLFGNRVSDHRESEELSKIYPHGYYFNTDNIDIAERDGYGIWDSKKRVFADDVLTLNTCAILLSGNYFELPPYQLQQIDTSNYANAYLILSSTEKKANHLLSAAVDSFQKGDYNLAFTLALESKKLDYQPKGKIDYILSIIYSNLHK